MYIYTEITIDIREHSSVTCTATHKGHKFPSENNMS